MKIKIIRAGTKETRQKLSCISATGKKTEKEIAIGFVDSSWWLFIMIMTSN